MKNTFDVNIRLRVGKSDSLDRSTENLTPLFSRELKMFLLKSLFLEAIPSAKFKVIQVTFLSLKC